MERQGEVLCGVGEAAREVVEVHQEGGEVLVIGEDEGVVGEDEEVVSALGEEVVAGVETLILPELEVGVEMLIVCTGVKHMHQVMYSRIPSHLEDGYGGNGRPQQSMMMKKVIGYV